MCVQEYELFTQIPNENIGWAFVACLDHHNIPFVQAAGHLTGARRCIAAIGGVRSAIGVAGVRDAERVGDRSPDSPGDLIPTVIEVAGSDGMAEVAI